jgi:hypothetical protein
MLCRLPPTIYVDRDVPPGFSMSRRRGIGEREIEAVACVEKDLDQLLSFFQIKNSKLWSRLRTTNLIERGVS